MNTFVPKAVPATLQALDPLSQVQLCVVWVLQNVFSADRAFPWLSDAKTTAVHIVPERIEFGDVPVKPAIVVKMGGSQATNMAMGHQMTTLVHTGDQVKADLESSMVVLDCVSPEPIEARRIAWIGRSALRGLRTVIQRNAGIHAIGDRISVEPVSPTAEGVIYGAGEQKFMSCKVMAPFYFADNWTVSYLNTVPMMKMELSLRSERSGRITHIHDPQNRPPRIPEGEHRDDVLVTVAQEM
jgi:hypothetical protein